MVNSISTRGIFSEDSFPIGSAFQGAVFLIEQFYEGQFFSTLDANFPGEIPPGLRISACCVTHAAAERWRGGAAPSRYLMMPWLY